MTIPQAEPQRIIPQAESPTYVTAESSNSNQSNGHDREGQIKPQVISMGTRTPKLSTFSGDDNPGKHKCSFDQWYFEVKTVQATYAEPQIKEAMIRSLKGTAANTIRFLGPSARVADILAKLLKAYSATNNKDVLESAFFGMFQAKGKKVQTFTARLEGALYQLRVKFPNAVPESEVDQKLKNHLFYGIHQSLRDSIRYIYRDENITYGDLMVAAREIETESVDGKTNLGAPHVKAKAATATEGETSESIEDGIGNRLDSLQKDVTQLMSITEGTHTSKKGGNKGNQNNNNNSSSNSNNNNNNNQGQNNSNQGRNNNNNHSRNNQSHGRSGPQPSAAGPFGHNGQPVQCYRCGGWGHFSRNCSSLLNYPRGEATANETPNPPPSQTNNDNTNNQNAQTQSTS